MIQSSSRKFNKIWKFIINTLFSEINKNYKSLIKFKYL